MIMTNPKIEALRKLVAVSVAGSPYEYEGFQWCALPQSIIAGELGISVETLRRMISKPPFVRERTHKEGKPITLIREGIPGPMTTRHVANMMSRIWRKRYGRAVAKAEYGCMIGLAENWPKGHQVEIFRLVISKEGWAEFMAGAWIEIEKLEGVKRFYKFPSLTVMRRFHTVAVELYQMHAQQKAGKAYADINNPKTLKLKLGGPSPALEALKHKKASA